jgi:hypothetical protein
MYIRPLTGAYYPDLYNSTLDAYQTIRTPVNIPYSRPTDWYTLPTLTTDQEKFVGLYAVFGDSDFVALSAQGNYTVDWGDGIVENFNSNVKAQHLYDYNALSGLTSMGYKQAIITVTPQSGQKLTNLNLQQRHSSATTIYTAGWLDISMVGANIDTLSIGGTNFVYMFMLEQFSYLGNNKITNFNSLFYNCISLMNMQLLYTGSGKTFNSMFEYCYSLQTIPLIDTSQGTDFGNMFYNCYSLQVIPEINTSSGISFTNMFNSCMNLLYLPLINTSYGINFSQMFSGCYSLQTIPQLDVSNGIIFQNMFSNCYSLQYVPTLNTSKATNFSGLFSSATQTNPPLWVNLKALLSRFLMTTLIFSASHHAIT